MIKLYNSLTRRKEEFKPITPNTVTMYSCGPTVYYFPHIGNMRAYLFMDSIRRMFKFNGYNVEGVMNYTDVGHLTSDSDSGDDKMEVASKREQKSPWEIAQYYIDVFNNDTKRLNIDMPEHCVRATDFINEMIEFNKTLEEKNYCYTISDGLYFDVQKFKSYGALSCKDLNSSKVARIEENEEKHHPYDFALWKFVDPSHIMKWDSPWGVGCPGWHIECSAMGRKFFGEHFDLHTGGIDHLSIHHENEIAQNDASAGHKVVNTWMHVEFLQVDGGKMSKSLNNIYTLDDLQNKGFEPLDYKYFNFTAHYKKQINFTWDALSSAKNARKSLLEILKEHKASSAKTSKDTLDQLLNDFTNAINDDLNFPLALSVVWSALKKERSIDIYNLVIKMDEALGLDLKNQLNESAPDEVVKIANERLVARNNKDYHKSDELRDKLLALGWVIKDGKDNYELIKK